MTIAVVDTAGVVLGVFRQQDAPMFGFDVAVKKARSAAFFSGPSAGTNLRAAGMGSYVDWALADGIKLDGTVAFSDRAIGFLHGHSSQTVSMPLTRDHSAQQFPVGVLLTPDYSSTLSETQLSWPKHLVHIQDRVRRYRASRMEFKSFPAAFRFTKTACSWAQ